MSDQSKSAEEWLLAPGIHATMVDGDPVFLSIPQDAYLCLPDTRGAVHLAKDRRTLLISDPALAEELECAGLVTREAVVDAARTPLPPPATTSALMTDYDVPGWKDIGPGCGSLLDVLVSYRGRRFAAILAAVQASRNALDERVSQSHDLHETVAGFHRWIPYAPVSGKCLLRSFMLLRLLHRRGHDASWVFGVRTWTFDAHCWLQAGDVVLDDHAERIAAFTPILVV